MNNFIKNSMIGLFSSLVGAGAGAVTVKKVMQEKLDKKQSLSDKHLDLFLMMNQWVKVKQEGKSLSEYFERNNYKHIAIYGMSYAGESLVNELKNSNIEIDYAIDKNANKIYADVEIVTLEEELEGVDVIVITAIAFFDEIAEMLDEKIDCPIISLEDILYEV